jgi:hypothetical protein
MRIPPALSHLREGRQPTETPHLLLTCAVDTRTDIILTYDISFQPDERAALLRLLHSGKTPRGSCFIAGRGYFSADVWRELDACGMLAVFRVKKTANAEIENALERRRRHTSVTIGDVPSRIATWSRQWDGLLKARLPNRQLRQCGAHTPTWDTLPLCYVPVADNWFLLTNTRLPPRALVQIYLSRWRIETVHKTLQSGGMGLGKNQGSEASIMHTTQAACLEHLVLRVQELQATHLARRANSGRLHKAWASASSRRARSQ